jgi:rare lipoprotein A
VSTKAAHLLDFHNRGTAWVRVDYVGRAPIEGSDDRILAATLRQDEPAPVPGSIKLAATPLVPATWTPPASRARFANAAASDALPETTGSQPMSYAGQPSGRDGTDQFLNGRGLY